MRLLTVFCLILSVSAFADTAYKSVDEEGNVIFTDKPVKGAEEIKLRKAQSIDAPAIKPFKYTPAQKEKKDEYTKLLITDPVNDSTIHSNDGKVTVTASLEPALKQQDQLVLYLDGQQVSTGKAAQFSLSDIERGTHNLSVAVMANDGKILRRSEDIVFYLRKVSVLSPSYKSIHAQPEASPAAPVPTPSL